MAERKTAKPKTFEQMLARLDEIVRSLMKGRRSARGVSFAVYRGRGADPHLYKAAR